MYIFAGPIFTREEWTLYLLGIFFAVALGLGVVGWVIANTATRITAKHSKPKNISLSKSVVVAVIVLAVGVLLFNLPDIFSDQNMKNKEDSCAVKAGYATPGDVNSPTATAEGQTAYQNCLNN